MFIIHGAYHFWPKRVAFRNDYCMSCRGASRSVAIRTFDVGHIFWIPVLPVGLWKHWRCLRCGRDPHVSPRTRRPFKWAGLAVLVVLCAAAWVAPVEAPDEWITWAFRFGGPLAAIWLLVYILRSPKDASLRSELKMVAPASETICPFCTTPLVAGPRWSCPGCGVVRY